MITMITKKAGTRKMIKGTLYMDSAIDMERTVTILANNQYEVRVKAEEIIDPFCTTYRIDYKRKDEWDE